MANVKDANNVSVFMFYTGTKENFDSTYERASEEEKMRYDNLIIFIKNGDQTDDEFNTGYIRACGRYYNANLSVLRSELERYTDNSIVSLENKVKGEIAQDILSDAKDFDAEIEEECKSYTDENASTCKAYTDTKTGELMDSIDDLQTEMDNLDIRLSEFVPISNEEIDGMFTSL